MPRAAQLPERLRYLAPVRKELAALGPEELNEDMDPSLFQRVLLPRIKGLSPERAKLALQGDCAELKSWLDQSGHEEDRLHFALGFLLIAAESPGKLLKASRRRPEPQIKMQFPPGAKPKPLHGGWRWRWRGFTVFVLPSQKACFDSEIEIFRERVPENSKFTSVSVLPVRLGRVGGFEQVEVIAEVGVKVVRYALRVPGGYATAAIMKKSTEWEEATFEEWFSTIEVSSDPH